MSRKAARGKPSRRRSRRSPGGWLWAGLGRLGRGIGWLLRQRVVWATLLVLLVAFLAYLAWLDRLVTSRFDGRRWDLPAHVYARPLELYEGQSLSIDGLVAELQRLGYRSMPRPDRPGSFRRVGGRIELVTRPFDFWDGPQPAQAAVVGFSSSTLSMLRDNTGGMLPLLRLDPPLIGSVFPADGEDRIIVEPDDVPALIPAALRVVEDRRFEQHHGIDVLGIMRALFVNLSSGQVRQGASTLTQQLVRSYFLGNERTFRRKAREALMSLLLELHYDKADILNAYLNEIYLGQDGSRAIHGFGLASQFYFGKPLAELQLHEVATLVAVVRGPSWYDPRRHPERVLARRNMVLKLLAENGVVEPAQADAASLRKLGVVLDHNVAASYYPAFMALVNRELAEHYREEDLTTAGLRVFTSLDPLLQANAESALAEGVKRLQRAGKPELEGAVVLADPQTAEVLAVVGGRRAGFEGYNRALEARRPIGSLVKPVVYLAALEDGYTLATRIDDAPIEVRLGRNNIWRPRNFDNRAHGEVPLVRALAESMNLATVRLGMEVGVPRVVEMLGRLGVGAKVQANPALLLGAVDLAPLEVAQLYSTLASGGYRSPLRAVRGVQGPDGTPLAQFPLSTEQAVEPAVAYQLNQALVQVMRRGTGRAAGNRLPPGIVAAGKTGTSNDLRDSWFAGFTQNLLGVVWIGYDDNQPTGLTGASGAMSVWSAVMGQTSLASFAAPLPAGLATISIDYPTGLAASGDCGDPLVIVVPEGTRVPPLPGCAGDEGQSMDLAGRTIEWLRGLMP
ncbi:MAG: penicillin-binding protein 1B [Gammaproteobacteria bacterium]|nr:penicillin-binding protein 1B [Gammaproteobacteria bacterium]